MTYRPRFGRRGAFGTTTLSVSMAMLLMSTGGVEGLAML